MSYPVRAEGLVNMYIYIYIYISVTSIFLYIYLYIYIYIYIYINEWIQRQTKRNTDTKKSIDKMMQKHK